jgi:hypothetical protein
LARSVSDDLPMPIRRVARRGAYADRPMLAYANCRMPAYVDRPMPYVLACACTRTSCTRAGGAVRVGAAGRTRAASAERERRRGVPPRGVRTAGHRHRAPIHYSWRVNLTLPHMYGSMQVSVVGQQEGNVSVYQEKGRRGYRAHVSSYENKKRIKIYLGSFETEEEARAACVRYREENPQKEKKAYDRDNGFWPRRTWEKKRRRAKQSGITFTLKRLNTPIPEICPVLGIPLDDRDFDHCPSLDRIDPNGGYTSDNVRVISCRANTIKNNATVEEVERVLAYMRSPQPARASPPDRLALAPLQSENLLSVSISKRDKTLK